MPKLPLKYAPCSECGYQVYAPALVAGRCRDCAGVSRLKSCCQDNPACEIHVKAEMLGRG